MIEYKLSALLKQNSTNQGITKQLLIFFAKVEFILRLKLDNC